MKFYLNKYALVAVFIRKVVFAQNTVKVFKEYKIFFLKINQQMRIHTERLGIHVLHTV